MDFTTFVLSSPNRANSAIPLNALGCQVKHSVCGFGFCFFKGTQGCSFASRGCGARGSLMSALTLHSSSWLYGGRADFCM